MKLEFLDYPFNAVAHPDYKYPETDTCILCALVIRPDTGEIVLLWKCGSVGNWGVSRNMPHFKQHKKELYDSLGDFEI